MRRPSRGSWPGSSRTHPSRGWDARRRKGGAPDAPELGRLRDRRIAATRRSRRRWLRCRNSGPAAQAAILGPQRARRHGQRGVAQRHHVAHVRLRRHASADDHPSGRAGRLGGAGARRASRRQRAAIDRCDGARHRRVVPRGQHDLPRSLRPRLAHHGLDRNARSGRRVLAAPGARRGTDGDGAGNRRIAADRRARAIRIDDQGRFIWAALRARD